MNLSALYREVKQLELGTEERSQLLHILGRFRSLEGREVNSKIHKHHHSHHRHHGRKWERRISLKNRGKSRSILATNQENLSDNSPKDDRDAPEPIDPEQAVRNYMENLYRELFSKTDIRYLGFLPCEWIQKKNTINTYFDHIYLLNLDRRPDRLQNMQKRLRKWGIWNWSRFPAIDGTESPHWEEWKHYSKSRQTRWEKLRYHRKAIGSPGSWAILKATYHMLQDAEERGYQRILVLQDDDLFIRNFTADFNRAIQRIPNNWKLLYLGATQHTWESDIEADLKAGLGYYYPRGSADGAFAVGIDRSIYSELVQEILRFDMPVDSGALRTVQNRYPSDSYVLYPNLIIADIRDSDLRHSRDLHNFGKRFRWNIGAYEIEVT